MFRMWGKLFKDNRLLQDMVSVNDDPNLNRTRKVFSSLEEICLAFDLSQPIWLDICVNDFRHHSKCRFTQDAFVEHIDFDYLEIQIIEE
ncbi:MAG: hypothetical protein IJA58_09105 [Lachnospiraceae bacterium]|nr:hypothetical protein [Lachnospiraceae bacterium]